VRSAAAEALAGRSTPQDLTILAEETRRLNQSALEQAFDAAEQLMTRHYRWIEPIEQPAVRAAMAWLTIAALMDNSA
jgi:hypothetical protein